MDNIEAERNKYKIKKQHQQTEEEMLLLTKGKKSTMAIMIHSSRKTKEQAQVLQRLTTLSNTCEIDHYPAYSMVYFGNTYPLVSNLSSGQHHPASVQLGPDQFPE